MTGHARFHVLKFVPVILMGLFFGLAAAPPGIYNAEFLLSRGLTKETAGFMYTFASAVGISILAILPLLLQRLGARRLLLLLTAVLGFAALGLAVFSTPEFTAIAFLFFLCVGVPIYSLIDIFIEQKIDGEEVVTGRVRGLYLMTINIAYTLGPLIAGLVITYYSFNHLYALAAFMTFVFFTLALSVTRAFKDPHYPHITLPYLIRTVAKDKLAVKIMSINFLLQMRYSVVVIYLAIYLHEVLGFSIAQSGLMITLGNIPFVLLQYPLGWLGDKWIGERKLIVLGFVMTCAGGFMIGLVPTPSLYVMTSILLVTFTGAAIIEVMSESFFFKHVKAKNDAHIMAFRMLIPLSYVIAPVFAAVVMFFLPVNYIFAAVATLCLLGIPLSLSLRDTR